MAKKKTAPDKEKGSMTVAEAGRKGGELVRDKYGSEHYSKIGQMGGSTRKAQLGDEGYAEMGRRGGLRVSEDRAHMAELGKKGGTNRGINIRKEKEAEKSA